MSRVQSPGSSDQSPVSRVQGPTSRVQRLESSVQGPASRVQRPESTVQSPASRVQRPESSVQSAASRVQRPESSVQLLRPESRNSGMPFFSLSFICFQQKELIKVQIWWNFTWAVEICLKFCTLQKSYLLWHWRATQSLKKNWLVISIMTWRIWWTFIQPLKSPKISLRWAIFVQCIWVWARKHKRSYLSWHGAVMQNLNKPWPCGFKNGIINWVNFH